MADTHTPTIELYMDDTFEINLYPKIEFEIDPHQLEELKLKGDELKTIQGDKVQDGREDR